MKYGIKRLTYYETPQKIRQALICNFGNEGPKFPIIAGCAMYDFLLISARKATARKIETPVRGRKGDSEKRGRSVSGNRFPTS
ncbi:hypothetical protein HanLR1_Chr04g0156911 [Helianthus annuus]|nr:hypothetical protein HanLR1_Chr04g0156911 [Helianthus annuus]